MILFLFTTMFSILIPLIVLMVSFIMFTRSFQDRDKMSPFECGFDPKSSARLPFSLRFFLLAVLFLVFDIEIVLILPAPMLFNDFSFNFFFFSFMFFFLILILGLIHEWNEGSLDWTK